MPKKSAGILMYRFQSSAPEVLLVHPGGPYWRKKDQGAWSIPKGEIEGDEEPWEAAQREFIEETGCEFSGSARPLDPLRQLSGKLVYAWAVEGNCEAGAIRSNSFILEWPPGSGNQSEFLEVDRAEWFTLPLAEEKILPAQKAFIEQLKKFLSP